MALFSSICDLRLLAVVNTALGWKPHLSTGLIFVPCVDRSLCRHGAAILYSAPHASLSFCKPRPKGHFSDREKSRGVTLSWEPRSGMADRVLGWLCAQYQPGSKAGWGLFRKRALRILPQLPQRMPISRAPPLCSEHTCR